MTPSPGPDPATPVSPALSEVLAEIERHVDAGGWDQPPRLYALVATDDLVRREPRLATALGIAAGDAAALTPVEQEDLPEAPGGRTDLATVLAQVGWPEEVLGCAATLEVMWGDDDEDPGTVDRATGEGRLAAAVLRSGDRASLLRVRSARAGQGSPGRGAREGDVLTGPDLASDLADALAATLEE